MIDLKEFVMKNYDEDLRRSIKKFRKNWYFYLLATLFVGGIFIIGVKIMDNYWEQKHKEYPIIKGSDTLNNKINDYFIERGFCYIEIEDSNKYRIENSRNYDYTPYNLVDFIGKEDSLVKRESSDTLYIYRDNKKYFFVLGEWINETP
jgi:hypothetical protein